LFTRQTVIKLDKKHIYIYI